MPRTVIRCARPTIHFRVTKEGHDPLITHVFVDGDEYLESDTVFGVRSSCVGQYVRHEAGRTPSGEKAKEPFYTLDYQPDLEPLSRAVAHA